MREDTSPEIRPPIANSGNQTSLSQAVFLQQQGPGSSPTAAFCIVKVQNASLNCLNHHLDDPKRSGQSQKRSTQIGYGFLRC